MDLISVILPAYNGEATIAETLRSVLAQTHGHLEVLVIDDGSSDRTAEIVEGFDDPRVTLHRFANAGAPANRNRGVRLATGTYLSLIDADDLWSPDKLEKQLAALRQTPEAGVAYSFTVYIDEAGRFLSQGYRVPHSGDVLRPIFVRFFLQNGSNALLRRRVFDQIGGFDESFEVCDDYEFYLRAAEHFPFVLVPEDHVFYRVSRGSLSSQPLKMRQAGHRVIHGAVQRNPELRPLLREAIAVTDGYVFGKALQNPREWRYIALCFSCLFNHLRAGRAGLRLLLERRHRAGFWLKRITSWLLAPRRPRAASRAAAGVERGDGTIDPEAWKRQDRRYHGRREIAASYDRRVTRFYELDHRRYTLDPWARRLSAAGARRVLDFGCGTGRASLKYLALGFKVISVDASLAMVAELRAKARHSGTDVCCVVADGERLPFRDGALDAVVCTGVLHHMPEIGPAIHSQARVLGEGGLLFASEPYGHRPWFSQPGHLLFSLAKDLRDRLRSAPPGARERPLGRHEVAEARDALEAQGMGYEITCFAYWPYACGYLPEAIAWPLMQLLDRLKSAERGDAVRIEARHGARLEKPAEGSLRKAYR